MSLHNEANLLAGRWTLVVSSTCLQYRTLKRVAHEVPHYACLKKHAYQGIRRTVGFKASWVTIFCESPKSFNRLGGISSLSPGAQDVGSLIKIASASSCPIGACIKRWKGWRLFSWAQSLMLINRKSSTNVMSVHGTQTLAVFSIKRLFVPIVPVDIAKGRGLM